MSSEAKVWIGGFIALCAFIFFIVFLSSMSLVSTDGGHVAVVRNGTGLMNPFNNHNIKAVIEPGSGVHWEGFNSQVHSYPASARYYTISANPGEGDRPGVDVFTGSTADGVNGVGIEGSVQFVLDTDPSILKQFDNKFGTRTFPVAGSGGTAYPWQGDKGWDAFLDAVFRNQVLDNALRIEIQRFSCAQLVPSCVYLNPTQNGNINTALGQASNTAIGQFQTDIASELQSDIDSTLRGHYLTVQGFRVSRISLPQGVQDAIDSANQQRVQVQRQNYLADQQVAQARGERLANEQKAAGIRALNQAYAVSPAKARIDAIAALPQDLKTLVIGGNSSGVSALLP